MSSNENLHPAQTDAAKSLSETSAEKDVFKFTTNDPWSYGIELKGPADAYCDFWSENLSADAIGGHISMYLRVGKIHQRDMSNTRECVENLSNPGLAIRPTTYSTQSIEFSEEKSVS